MDQFADGIPANEQAEELLRILRSEPNRFRFETHVADLPCGGKQLQAIKQQRSDYALRRR